MVKFIGLEGRLEEKPNSPFLSGKSPDNAWGLAMLLSGIYKDESTFRDYMNKHYNAGSRAGTDASIPAEWPMPGKWYATYNEVFVKARELLTSPDFQVNAQSVRFLESALEQIDTQEGKLKEAHGDSYKQGKIGLVEGDFNYLRGLIHHQIASLYLNPENRNGRKVAMDLAFQAFSFEKRDIEKRRKTVLDPYVDDPSFARRAPEILGIMSNGAAEFGGEFIFSQHDISSAFRSYEATANRWKSHHPDRKGAQDWKDIETTRTLLGLRAAYQLEHDVPEPNLPFQAYLAQSLRHGNLTQGGGVLTSYGMVFMDSLQRAGQGAVVSESLNPSAFSLTTRLDVPQTIGAGPGSQPYRSQGWVQGGYSVNRPPTSVASNQNKQAQYTAPQKPASGISWLGRKAKSWLSGLGSKIGL